MSSYEVDEFGNPVDQFGNPVSPIEAAWAQAPGTTAAGLIAAKVEERVNQVLTDHVLPNMEAQNEQRYQQK